MIIELLDRHGRVRAFFRVKGSKALVGRAFNCDVVLDDPYVDEQHLRLSRARQGLFAEDLGSLNGTLGRSKTRLQGRHLLAAGEILQLGRTRLRITDPRRHSHAPTLALPGDAAFPPWMRSGWAAAGLLLLLLGLSLLAEWLKTYSKTEAFELLDESMAMSMAALLWAGVWSLVGLAARRGASFAFQLSVTSVFFGLLSLVDMAQCHVLYALGARGAAADWYGYLSGLPLIPLIWFQLRESTDMAPSRARKAALLLPLLIWTVLAVEKLKENGSFKGSPTVCDCMSPLPFRVSPDESPQDFLDASAGVFDIQLKEKRD